MASQEIDPIPKKQNFNKFQKLVKSALSYGINTVVSIRAACENEEVTQQRLSASDEALYMALFVAMTPDDANDLYGDLKLFVMKKTQEAGERQQKRKRKEQLFDLDAKAKDIAKTKEFYENELVPAGSGEAELGTAEQGTDATARRGPGWFS